MSRAEADLRTAMVVMQSGDEYDLQVAAFHIQQCVEKILKVVIEEYGYSYTETGKISDLLQQLPKEQKVLSSATVNSIERDEALLSKWESATRYDDPYMASSNLVKELYDKVKLFFEEAKQNLDKLDKNVEKEISDIPSLPVGPMNLFRR